MGTMNENEKRDFVAQIIVLTTQNASTLIDAGYDPTNRIAGLQEKLTTAEEAEGKQKEAQIAAQDATTLSKETLKACYDDASQVINVVEGVLGKDNTLVKKLRQLRKTRKNKSKDTTD